MTRDESGVGELTHSQKQIWIGQRLHTRSPLYNMAFAFVFPAEIRPEAFQEAWRRVASRSDALATRITEKDGRARWTRAATAPASERLDFSNRPAPEDSFLRWCEERSARPLDLDKDLVESVLVRLGAGRTGWYLNQHHLIADAWSTQLLYRSVAAEYHAVIAGESGHRSWLVPFYEAAATLPTGGEERKRAEQHWASRRRRPGRRVALYGHRAEPDGTANQRRTLELDEDRSRALDALAGERGFLSLSSEISRFAVFATLLVSWLHRVSGADEVGFDAPVNGRPTDEAKRALGLFIEMFPFAAQVQSRDTFRSLGARCLEEAKRFLGQAFPGLSSPSGAEAGNIVLNYFPASFGDFAGLPVEAHWIHSGHGDSLHALRLQVHDFSGRSRYTLHFDGHCDALPDRLWDRALAHFERLLDVCLENPDRPIGEADIRGDDERRSLATLNAATSAPLPDRSVVERFEAQAELEPDRVALRQGGTETTFAELRRQSRALAAILVDRGIEPGDRVALLARRSTLSVVAILAILRARAAWQPIDPTVPTTRLHDLLRDSGARLLLLGDEAASAVVAAGIATLSIAEGIRAGGDKRLGSPCPALDDLAYVIYTSGSTGRPKGVPIEHRGLSDYLAWAERTYVRGDRLTFPLFTSLAFDLTLTSLFLPLVTGGTLEIYPESTGEIDGALIDVARADAVDFIKLTPSHLSLLVRAGLEGSRVRRIVVGGESLPTHLAAAVSSQLQDQVEIYNEYGPTEAVVGCVAHRYDPTDDRGPSVPIGAPADRVEIAILNAVGTPVPEGVPGELWVSRHGLTRGYFGRGDLTADSFVSRDDRPGEAWYRTGDQVRMIDPAKLEFLGRSDRQLKVSGFRVEAEEVEAVMSAVPGVEQCAVVAQRRVTQRQSSNGKARHCLRCGLSSNYPRAILDDEGICSICISYEAIRDRAQAYFRSPGELRELFAESARRHDTDYDCLMLFSGGKDSTYALCRLVEMGLSVYAFTLDNGFISERAKENIRRVTGHLGVPIEFATTPAMNAIFRDSLMRYSNVCQGCFKTIYTLSLQRARKLGIPIIVTGLSRGQMFETRLTEEMFRDGGRTPEEIDAAVLAARKVYHRVSDEASRSLDVEIFQDDRIFDQIRFVDFYRYVDVGLDEVYAYLDAQDLWVRPEDTGRSTNCLINDIGIHVHQRQRGFHNYALPYSWDVRLGHKSREAALAELDDDIDPEYVRDTLVRIGFDLEKAAEMDDRTVLCGYYVEAGKISETELREHLATSLPPWMIPTRLERIQSIPLTSAGKLDERALAARPSARSPSTITYRPPQGPVEEFLADVWRESLDVERVGVDDSFFELGGTSLDAMEVMIALCHEYDIELPLETLFSHPTLRDLARVAEDRILADVADLPAADPHSNLESDRPGG